MPPKEWEGTAPPEGAGAGDEVKSSGGGCCCCKGKVEPEGPVKMEAAYWSNTKRHDSIWCLIFLAYWLGMVVIVIVAASKNGAPVTALLYGSDSQGYNCGADNAPDEENNLAERNLENQMFLHFPLEGQDPAALATSGGEDISLYGICVDACPRANSKFEYDCDCLTATGIFERRYLGCPEFGADMSSDRSNATKQLFGDFFPGEGEAYATSKWSNGGKPDTDPAKPETGAGSEKIKHDCVCEPPNSGREQACWKASYPTKNVAFRCIPCANPDAADCQVVVKKTTKCIGAGVTCDPGFDTTTHSYRATGNYGPTATDPAGWACAAGFNLGGTADSYATKEGVHDCPVSTDERRTLSEVDEQHQPPNMLGDLASGGMATVMAYANDIMVTAGVIGLIGAGVATVGAAFWVFLMKLCVKPLVWITIVGFLLATAGMTYIGLVKSGQLQTASEELEGSATEVAPEDEQWMWTIVWMAAGLTCLISLVMFAMRFNKIRQATTIIQQASNALADMPLMIVFPVIPLIAAVLFFTYFLAGFALIMTADTISLDDISAAVADAVGATALGKCEATGANGNQTLCDAAIASNDPDVIAHNASYACYIANCTYSELPVAVPVAGSSGEDIAFYLAWYHLFGWLWVNQLISAISMTAIAGAYSWWYFASQDQEKQTQNKFAFMRSLKRVFRYHIGSMVFGAFIVAVVQFIRIVLAYIDKQTKTWQEKSKLLKLAFKVVACCLWCFEKAVKFITRNAYIFIAINGKSFCKSAKNAFITILKNLFLVGFVNLVSVVLILIGKLIITIACAVLVYLYIESSASYTYVETEAEPYVDGVTLLQSPLLPVLLTAILAWFVSSLFFYTYQLGVDTLLMCFIEEKKLIDDAVKAGQDVAYSGPQALIDFMKKTDKKARKDAEEEQGDAP